MQEYVITIDTGTTNTRAILLDGARKVIGSEKREVGVRNTAIDGNNTRLKLAVRECIEALLQHAGISYDSIKRIIASGMITSNVGLVEVPHIVAPAGARELADATSGIELPDVCPLPIWFIPGVKNSDTPVSKDNFEAMDIMRGEEVESIPIIEAFHKGEPMLIVLPGSHTKFVPIDASARITGCLTTISGELLASITNGTIIADAVGRKFVSEDTYDREMLLLGYETAQKVGLGRACFSGRILNQFVTKNPDKIANFILGSVLQSDIAAVKSSSALRLAPSSLIVVAGKSPLRQALADILTFDGFFHNIRQFSSDEQIPLSSMGAYMIAQKRKLV